MEVLKADIRSLSNETKEKERNSESDILSRLKGIQNNMKVCKSQLETLLEWDQLCSSCQEALSSEDTEVISFCVFHFIDGCIYLGGYEQVCPVAVRTTRPRRSSFCIAAKSFDFGKTASSQADKTVAVQQGRAVNLSLQDLCFPPLGICLH